MSKWKATPFVVRRTLVVEGGWLQSPWVVDSKVVDGGEFITLALTDRSLAKAMGMNMSERSPLAQCSVFSHMASARDAQVDSLIFAAKVDKDPMGDGTSLAQAQQMAPMPSRGRAMAFAEADIPDTISVKMASFVTPDGQRVEEHTLRVVTTPKRRANVTMEATAENFEWLLKAAQCDWDSGVKPQRGIDDEEESMLPELAHPCKYQKTESGKLKIVCSYRQHGVWKKHQKAVGVSIQGDNSSFESIIRSCEEEVLNFFRAHHEVNQGDEPREQAPAPLTGA